MKYTFFLVLFCLSKICNAQSLISGRVVDAEDQKPLAYASIIIQNTSSGVLSDDEGFFEIAEEFAKDSIVISYIGYETKIITIKKGQVLIEMNRSENTIEEIVVTPIDADSIMKIAIERYPENHIRHNTKQAGFMRANFKEEGEIFQISESSYDVFYKNDGEESERRVAPKQSRMVIDSAIYKEMNEVFHFKKGTFIVEPLNFVGIGQAYSSGGGQSKESKKWSSVYEYMGKKEYQGREVYEIKADSYRKKDQLLTTTYLIDVETYAFLSIEFSSVNEDEINKVVPFVVRTAMRILGFNFSVNKISGRVYYRDNGEFFELDKGMFYLSGDVARGGEWIKGDMTQEFYLQEQLSVSEVPEKIKWMDSEIVYDFEDAYFESFHLPTSSKTREQIELIQEKNISFEGEIHSEKHKKWLKKQQKKNK